VEPVIGKGTQRMRKKCAPRLPVERSPLLKQVTSSKQALKTDQFPVTPYAADCGKKIYYLSTL
jgi:hypothetical protein